MLDREQVLEQYFPEVRAWLLQIAAVMDRFDRAAGQVPQDDQRLERLRQSLDVLADPQASADRAQRIQEIFSDAPEWEPSMTKRS